MESWLFKESCNKSPTGHEIKNFKVTVIENYTNGAALFFSSYPLTYNHAWARRIQFY